MVFKRLGIIVVLSSILLCGCGKNDKIVSDVPTNQKESIDYYTAVVTEYNDYHTDYVYTLFGFADDVMLAEYPCYEIWSDGQSGGWSTIKTGGFNLVKKCDWKTDKCFDIFEKNGKDYYSLVMKCSSMPDSSEGRIIVSQDVFDDVVKNWNASQQ